MAIAGVWRNKSDDILCINVKSESAGCASPIGDSYSAPLFLRDTLRIFDGRLRISPEYPKYAHVDNCGR